jgi:hypothetical protein
VSPRRSKDRLLAWLVTGPLGRGGAFFLDFSAALARGARGLFQRHQ